MTDDRPNTIREELDELSRQLRELRAVVAVELRDSARLIRENPLSFLRLLLSLATVALGGSLVGLSNHPSHGSGVFVVGVVVIVFGWLVVGE